MKMNDLATPFLADYEATANYYEMYFQQHPDVFDFYFQFHCKNKEEKLNKALLQHPNKLLEMKDVTEKLARNIEEITTKYEKMFNVIITDEVHIFVGLGGSNAYTTYKEKPGVAFCIERITSEETGLRTLIAHEFGHVIHHSLTLRVGVKEGDIDWQSPSTWLIQEGIAIYLSTQVVEAEQDVYFAFQRDEEWLVFAEENKEGIIAKFQKDLVESSSHEVYKEWFSINGGEHFGYTRLAYYIGYEMVRTLVKRIGIEQTILFWLQSNFKKQMNSLLMEIKK